MFVKSNEYRRLLFRSFFCLCQVFPSFLFCSKNIFRLIITIIFSTIVLFVNITCFVKLCCFYKKFIFDMIVLTTQITEVNEFFIEKIIVYRNFKAIFIFITAFWIRKISLLFTRNYLGLISFSLIAFSFMKLHFQIRDSPHFERLLPEI